MNTEKIEKLKKSLSNSKIPADLKPKIEAEIKRLESLDAKQEVKEEAKEEAKEVVAKKPRAKRVATKKATAKPSQTRKPKRTAMSLAKEIRKEGESWNDARARASKMMKEETKTVSKKVESELDKLSKLVRSKKELRGQVGKTNLLIDAKRKAKPMGRRVSKDGNVYYENRANRTDIGTYGKYHLAEGAYLTDGTFGNFQNQVFNDGGAVTNERRYVNKGEDYEVRYSKPILRRKGYDGKRDFATGGRVESLTKELHRLQRDLNSSRLQTYRLGDNSQEAKDRKNEREVKLARFNEVLKELRESDAKFELGGVMATDLAGHTGGGTGGLNAGMPLDGFSNTGYTGLVGETGAMSTGEMFAKGGEVKFVEDFSNGDGIQVSKSKTEDGKTFYTAFVTSYPFRKLVPMNENKDYVVKRAKKIYSDMLEYKKNEKYELGGGLPSGAEQSYMITEALGNPAQHFAKGGGVRTINGKEYSYGRNWTNDHKHTNKGEEHEVNYTRKGKFLGVFNDGGDFQSGVYVTGGGVEDDSPKIYVADLEAYNNGRLSGVWLDLTDYNDADELMEAINDFLKTSGGEEYAIHDVENIPSNIYSEYMGQRDFEELYEMIDLAKENNLPLSVVQEVVSQYDASAVDEFYGKYDDAEDFAQQLVDDIGIESFTDFQYYLYVTDTDRRLLSQDMADSYVDDIKDEDGGNRLIEEAGLDVEEYEEAESDRQEEMLDEAREIVYDEYYNNWMEGLSDPYYFLVEEQGMYDAESFANANFVRIDFEKLADALEQDYTYIYDGASLYVFNIR